MDLSSSAAASWQKSFPVRRGLFALFLAGHLTVMVLNSLPWSPLVEPLFPLYRPYLGLTGTVQDGWSMYDAVHTWDNHFRLMGTLQNGSTVPLEFPGQTVAGRAANRLRDFLEERDENFLESFATDVPGDVKCIRALPLRIESRPAVRFHAADDL